jgi:hypothetical protein
MATQLTRVRYAGFDFDTHEDELLARLQIKFAAVYNDFAVSSLGIMLVDIFSYGLDTLSFYLDRRATDNFLVTSRTVASATRLSRQLGYKPGPSSASSVDLSISLASTFAFAVPVPFGFQFKGPAGLIFESQEEVTFTAGDTSTKVITASEGETLTQSFFSDGSENQVFDISNVPDGKFIVGRGTSGQSRVTVTVDGSEWTEEEFLQFGETEQYEVGYTDDPPTLRFGDSIAGKIPDPNAEIKIVYFASSGVDGAATAETITQVVNPLVVSFETIGLNINNPQGTSGGSDPEALSSIKANAPSVFKSRNVNVTLEDYEARSQSFVDPVFGAISVARAINVRGSSSDAFLSSTLASIRAASASFIPITSVAVDSIEADSTAISASVVDAQSDDDALVLDLSEIDAAEDAARTSNESSRTAAGVIQSNASGVTSDLSSIDTERGNLFTDISAAPVGTAGANDMGATLQTTLLGYLATLDISRSSANGRTSEISAQAATILSNVTLVTTELDTIDANAVTAEVRRAAVRSDVDAIDVSNTSIASTAGTLETDIIAVDNTIDGFVDDVDEHVDSFLSNECKANLIEVPVLTLDSEGFYVVPTNGLQKSLQLFLEGAKEVTQVVKVTGASNQLVSADVDVLVGILTGYNEATVRSQVEAAILDVLRGRAFGKTLRLSELYAPIAPEEDDIQIDGVEYVNIFIVGPSGRIDTDGNLPVEEFEVVTRGVISISSEVISKSLVGQ